MHKCSMKKPGAVIKHKLTQMGQRAWERKQALQQYSLNKISIVGNSEKRRQKISNIYRLSEFYEYNEENRLILN